MEVYILDLLIKEILFRLGLWSESENNLSAMALILMESCTDGVEKLI